MQPDADGVVGFLQFWKGMEDLQRQFTELCKRNRVTVLRKFSVLEGLCEPMP